MSSRLVDEVVTITSNLKDIYRGGNLFNTLAESLQDLLDEGHFNEEQCRQVVASFDKIAPLIFGCLEEQEKGLIEFKGTKVDQRRWHDQYLYLRLKDVTLALHDPKIGRSSGPALKRRLANYPKDEDAYHIDAVIQCPVLHVFAKRTHESITQDELKRAIKSGNAVKKMQETKREKRVSAIASGGAGSGKGGKRVRDEVYEEMGEREGSIYGTVGKKRAKK